MAISTKTVTTDVTANNITVTVTDAPNYPATSAIVTVKKLPDGPTKAPDQDPTEIPGGANFIFTNVPNGMNLVTVDCGHKLFSRVVSVGPRKINSFVFHFTETAPADIPAKFPQTITQMLPTAKELKALKLPTDRTGASRWNGS